MEMTFVIEGKVKPYVRMTRVGKFCRPEAQEYMDSQAAIARQFRQQMNGNEKLPAQTPLAVEIRVTMPGGLHRSDADNLTKSLLDAANGIVYPDDRWIDAIRFTRIKGEAYTTVFTVSRLEENQ